MTPDPRRRLAGAALLFVLAAIAAGCFNPFDPRISRQGGVSTPPPAPTSPEGVLRLFEWCWNNRAIDQYREIFTDDYRFYFAVNDTAGNIFRDRPWLREDEMASTTNLFQGGSVHPPASRISLQFAQNLRAFPDSRPNKAFPWHQQINTTVVLEVTTDEESYQVTGSALYRLTRGDSAEIPEELRARGFRPDSTRWYIEQWEDQTQQTGPGPNAAGSGAHGVRPERAAAVPRPATWGLIKATYRR